jgi:hypothetical protein
MNLHLKFYINPQPYKSRTTLVPYLAGTIKITIVNRQISSPSPPSPPAYSSIHNKTVTEHTLHTQTATAPRSSNALSDNPSSPRPIYRSARRQSGPARRTRRSVRLRALFPPLSGGSTRASLVRVGCTRRRH